MEAYAHDILPLETTLARINFEMVQAGRAALDTVKLTPRRTRWFKDLLSAKACNLLADPLGLANQDIEWLDGLVQAFGPPEAQKIQAEIGTAEFEEIKEFIQFQAGQADIEMDLDDLTPHLPPEELDRILRERFAAAEAQYQASKMPRPHPAASPPKPSWPGNNNARRWRKRRHAPSMRSSSNWPNSCTPTSKPIPGPGSTRRIG